MKNFTKKMLVVILALTLADYLCRWKLRYSCLILNLNKKMEVC